MRTTTLQFQLILPRAKTRKDRLGVVWDCCQHQPPILVSSTLPHWGAATSQSTSGTALSSGSILVCHPRTLIPQCVKTHKTVIPVFDYYRFIISVTSLRQEQSIICKRMLRLSFGSFPPFSRDVWSAGDLCCRCVLEKGPKRNSSIYRRTKNLSLSCWTSSSTLPEYID